MRKMIAVAVVAVAMGFATTGFASTVKAIDASVKNPATPTKMETDINNLVFTGTVKKIPNGTALVTKNATYLLTGGNFDGIVGREVNIIGKVIKEGSIEKIHVARAQLAE